MSAAVPPLLDARQLTVAVPAGYRTRPLLHGISLSIAPGERVALVGFSGSGKTTLLQALMALLPVQAGQIHCQGQAVAPQSVRRLRWYRRCVQYVPQSPGASLDPRRTVETLLKEPLHCLGLGDAAARITRVLDQVELPQQVRHQVAGTLSGGQAQRVAIARALAIEPKLLIADEPVSGLDLPLREQMMTVFERCVADTDMALLMVSHDLSGIARLCERALVMADGRLVEDRPMASLLAAPRHPCTQQLIAAAWPAA